MASCLTVIQCLITLRSRQLSALVHGQWSKPAAAGIREVLHLEWPASEVHGVGGAAQIMFVAQ